MVMRKNLEHMLTKDRHKVLSHFLLGKDLTPEQRTEAIFSFGSVSPGGVVPAAGGKCLRIVHRARPCLKYNMPGSIFLVGFLDISSYRFRGHMSNKPLL